MKGKTGGEGRCRKWSRQGGDWAHGLGQGGEGKGAYQLPFHQRPLAAQCQVWDLQQGVML